MQRIVSVAINAIILYHIEKARAHMQKQYMQEIWLCPVSGLYQRSLLCNQEYAIRPIPINLALALFP